MPLTTPSGGLEELVDATSGKEIVATPAIVDRFEDLTKKYEYFLANSVGIEWLADRIEWVTDLEQEVVLPCDINLFLQQTREYENHKNYTQNTGIFISQLIKNSYNAGNNKFELNFNYLRLIDRTALSISGTKEKIIVIVITGEVGDSCGVNTRHSMFTVEKAGDWCGQYAQHSTFTIKEAGPWCGRNAEHSTFTIGEAGEWCGSSSKHSTFNTHNSLQYERFKKSVPQKNGNAVYLLSDTGSILQGGPW